tara:strand:+ start:1610 stop:1744 length:135 start_codon:yes stop_codon:yes gene_type:complete
MEFFNSLNQKRISGLDASHMQNKLLDPQGGSHIHEFVGASKQGD